MSSQRRPLSFFLVCFGLVSLSVACSTDPGDVGPGDPSGGGGSSGGGSSGGLTNEVPIGQECVGDSECGDGRCEANACVPGKTCTGDEQCEGGRCIDGGCAPPSCTDGVKGPGESDVDCGGSSCPRCATGMTCVEATDCAEKSCVEGVCAAPTASDGIRNGTETDVDCGGGAPTDAPRCADGLHCKDGEDCVSRVCDATAGTCTPATITDGVKNGNETDVDCGGPDAPRCDAGQGCLVANDCDSRFCTANVCEPRKAGRKDGDETDIDCGGTVAPKCDWEKSCLEDADCTSNACSAQKKCLVGPSCRVQNGGQTCGPNGNADCCRSLPVTNYPLQGGKTVYLDKYEITAGRMRAFVEAVKAANGGVPNIKGYINANRPARWNDAWSAILPQRHGVGAGNAPPPVTYTIKNPTPAASSEFEGFLYPGPDVYATMSPVLGTWKLSAGTYTVYPGLVHTFGESHFFQEYQADPYAVTHGLNCSNDINSWGFGTYWQPADDLKAVSPSSKGKFFAQNVMDQQALNCTPNAMFAAFCAWDGGELVTEPVMSYVVNGRIGSAANCPPGLIMSSDSGTACPATWYGGHAPDGSDGSGRVAPPGRIAADVVRIVPGDEGWHDLKGNLHEVVVLNNDRFDFRGYGLGYSTILYHKAQMMTPRGKGASFGARCMRVK